MIWEDIGNQTIGNHGKIEIKFVTEKLNSKKYVEMIGEQMNTYATRIAGWIYFSTW